MASTFGITSHRPAYPVRQPLKHARYPGKVTVCIAAICQKDEGSRIVLCSDTRTSAGDYGSTDSTTKVHVIMPGWAAQAARRPDSAKELIERIREWFTRSSTKIDSVHAVVSLVNEAVKEFESSPLHEKNCCELLITGFVKDRPVIVIVAGNDRGRLTVRLADGFFAIGSGALIATVILNCREYNKREEFEHAVYLVYEAKRFSEKADGVGPQTDLLWIGPEPANTEIMNDTGIPYLESIFQKSGLRSDVLIDPFPDEFSLEV